MPIPATATTEPSLEKEVNLFSLKESEPFFQPFTSDCTSRSIAAMMAILLMHSPAQPGRALVYIRVTGTSQSPDAEPLLLAELCSPSHFRLLRKKQTFSCGPFLLHR